MPVDHCSRCQAYVTNLPQHQEYHCRARHIVQPLAIPEEIERMLLDRAIAQVRSRLASLDAERAEAELPLWIAALHAEFRQEVEHLCEIRLCPYCSREHDSRIACPEYAHGYGFLRPGETQMTIIGRGGALPARSETIDRSDGLPDDAQLPLDAWNAKAEAMLADVGQWQKAVEEAHGNTDCPAE